MPDILDANGLQIKTYSEIRDELIASFKNIYGSTINVESNTPDGQIINIFAQAGVDIRELLAEVYNSMDPDNAQGVILDQRVAFNNIKRQTGTYTIQDIDILADKPVTIYGLDGLINDPEATGYTVADDTGTQFILSETTTLTAGTNTLAFRAARIGAILTTPNTITNLVTAVQGVVSCNNPNIATSIGIDEELDPALRERRKKSIANSGTSSIDNLEGSLLALSTVNDCRIYENDTNETVDGIPPHSIYIIVDGGLTQDIIDTIYIKKNPGCGTYGSVQGKVISVNGEEHVYSFDRVANEYLYIKFDIQTVTQGTLFDEDAIKEYIAENLDFNIYGYADTSYITQIAIDALQNITGLAGVPVNVEISKDNINWYDYLLPSLMRNKWLPSAERITTNVV